MADNGAQLRVVGEHGGVVIAEDGPLVAVLDRRLGGLAVTAFVAGILTIILLLNGIIFAVVDPGDGGRAVGLLLLLSAVVPGTILVVAIGSLRRRRRAPLVDLELIAVFDRQAGVLRDPDGTIRAPLSEVRIRRRSQLTSSSRQLVAELPSGWITLARGNPFAGGLGDLDAVLMTVLAGTSVQQR